MNSGLDKLDSNQVNEIVRICESLKRKMSLFGIAGEYIDVLGVEVNRPHGSCFLEGKSDVDQRD